MPLEKKEMRLPEEARDMDSLLHDFMKNKHQCERAFLKVEDPLKTELESAFDAITRELSFNIRKGYQVGEISYADAKELLTAATGLTTSIMNQQAITKKQTESIERLMDKHGYTPAKDPSTYEKKQDEFQEGVYRVYSHLKASVGGLAGLLVVAAVLAIAVSVGSTFGASLFALLPLGLAGASYGLPDAIKAHQSAQIKEGVLEKSQEQSSVGDKIKILKEGLQTIQSKENNEEDESNPDASSEDKDLNF